MVADVSSFVRGVIDGGDANESGKSTAPIITRDLLGGCCAVESKELDLDLQVPCGWEKRLDLKSGRVYLQRSNSSNSSSSTTNSEIKSNKFQDLNVHPKPKPTLNLYDDSLLDLKLVSSPSCSTSPSSSNFHSVCTLDKVKSALQRAEKESASHSVCTLDKVKSALQRAEKESARKRLSSSPLSTSSSSVKDSDVDEEERSSGSFAVGCPSCLLYVLVTRGNPKCPFCNCDVPLPGASKKPRIDLNISI